MTLIPILILFLPAALRLHKNGPHYLFDLEVVVENIYESIYMVHTMDILITTKQLRCCKVQSEGESLKGPLSKQGIS